ncbi:MAG TPA: tetratricopeptide repeat protein, partial [Bryobacteraceae bacterium]|nr:tetratricopeptide repeat protein [Bryobacteraceae bacterium]
VVRAGGDGYILKNGPSRHLVDAISYVRDGGQYFSPQLRRDGLDRHLLQEPVRPPVQSRVSPSGESAAKPRRSARAETEPEYAGEEEGEYEDRPGRSSGRPLRERRLPPNRARRRTADPQRFRERLREEGNANLEDRDYEILSLMADGIKPILDRLDDIEGRVIGMESGEEPVPSDVRSWLNTQMADTFRTGRTDVALGRTVQELEARLPQLIEEAVTSRFQQMAGKLHEEIEETHVRTLETFVKNIQVKLVQRVTALETDMSKQAEAMQQLREYSARTEDNLGRLISGVDRLAKELPQRLALPEPGPAPAAETRSARHRSQGTGFSLSPKVFWPVVAGIALVIIVSSQIAKTGHGNGSRTAAASAPAAASAESGAAKPPRVDIGTDTKTKMQAAQEYADRKDYTTAEDIYKQILKAEPNNVDAMKALASVLYREDKIEESAAILEKLPKN